MPLNMVTLDENGDAEPSPEAQQAPDQPANNPKDARLASLVRANAARLARRVAGGNDVNAAVLSEALAIEPSRAVVWLESRESGLSEAEYLEQFLELAA